jgi:putative transcriptional regulator
MYKYTQSEFVAMMDELMYEFKKSCEKTDEELDLAYKILNPSPIGGFVDSLVRMNESYSTKLWEMKRKQIKSFISECDSYQMDDIVAYCRARFFKEEVNRVIRSDSIEGECNVCIYADGAIFGQHWPYICAKVYVSIAWIDEDGTSYTRVSPSAAGFMSYQIDGSIEEDLKVKENMSITEMRKHLNVSRAEFSRRYSIPIRTLENWESGKSKCPDYVRQLLERAVLEDCEK